MKATTNGRRTMRRRRRGMTLIEIMVVITILGLIAAAVGIAVVPQMAKARQDRTRTDIKTIEGALDLYQTRKGRYPDTGQGLQVLVQDQLLKEPPRDAWGNEFIYVLEGGKPLVKSYGADGQPGGTDTNEDITNRESAPQ
jgi:general secretion pathway protein G